LKSLDLKLIGHLVLFKENSIADLFQILPIILVFKAKTNTKKRGPRALFIIVMQQ
jgi:hypothetical protein